MDQPCCRFMHMISCLLIIFLLSNFRARYITWLIVHFKHWKGNKNNNFRKKTNWPLCGSAVQHIWALLCIIQVKFHWSCFSKKDCFSTCHSLTWTVLYSKIYKLIFNSSGHTIWMFWLLSLRDIVSKQSLILDQYEKYRKLTSNNKHKFDQTC